MKNFQHETPNVPVMLTINDAAKVVGLSPYSIRQFVLKKNKHIKFIRAGKKYLINLKSLVEFLNTGEEESKKVEIAELKKVEV